MRQTCGMWLAALVVLWPAGGRAQAPGPDSELRMVTTERDVYLAMPPQLVAAPVVTGLHLSPEGRYALITRTYVSVTQQDMPRVMQGGFPPSCELSMLLWNRRAQRSVEVWRSTQPGDFIGKVAWLPSADAALVLVSTQGTDPTTGGPDHRQAVLMVDASGAVRTVAVASGDLTSVTFDASPSQPLAVVRRTSYLPAQDQPASEGVGAPRPRLRRELFIVDGRGRMSPAVAVPDDARSCSVAWSVDGSPLLAVQGETDTGAPRTRWYSIAGSSASLAELSGEPKRWEPKPEPPSNLPVRTRLTIAMVTEQRTSRSIQVLWLEGDPKSEQPRALLCADCAEASILPAGDMVIYRSQDALWSVPLVHMPKQVLKTMADSARTAVALSNGKQIGLAILLYAQDHDNVLPDANNADALRSFLASLATYLKNGDLLQGFSYTFGGGKLSEVAKPAETELGFLSTATGLVVVYADGHVRLRQ